MVISKTLEMAIRDKNVVGLHSVMYTIAHEDPAFLGSKFDETLEYIKTLNIDGFIEEYDGELFLPEEDWDEQYWALVASELQDNFSVERIAHLKEVGKAVYGKAEAVQAAEEVDDEVTDEMSEEMDDEIADEMSEEMNDEVAEKMGDEIVDEIVEIDHEAEEKSSEEKQVQEESNRKLKIFLIGAVIVGALIWLFRKKEK